MKIKDSNWIYNGRAGCNTFRLFQIAVRSGRKSPQRGGIRNFARGRGGGDFFTKWWGPEEDWFWPFKPFSNLKTAFCEYWTSLKITISMTCVSKSMKLKQKRYRSNDCNKKCCYYWVITWKLLFSRGRGINLWCG